LNIKITGIGATRRRFKMHLLSANRPGDGLHGLLADGPLVIAEHRRKQHLEGRYGALERTRLLEQGDAALSFCVAAQGL
jgi:hypothetical protein